MKITDQLKQDISDLSVQEEVYKFRDSLKEYIRLLSEKAWEIGKVKFDFDGGTLTHHEYFKFKQGWVFLLNLDNPDLIHIDVFGVGVDVSFRYYRKIKNLTYWSHHLSKLTGKQKLLEVISIIDEKIEELKQ